MLIFRFLDLLQQLARLALCPQPDFAGAPRRARDHHPDHGERPVERSPSLRRPRSVEPGLGGEGNRTLGEP
jgi:hypothetical protein